MTELKLGETITLDFCTHAPTTGQVTDDDGTPTVEVFEDDTDAAILSPTAVKRTAKTGNYRVAVAATAGNGFEAGKSYNVIATGTVGGVSGKGRVGQFIVRANEIDDVPTAAEIVAGMEAAATWLDILAAAKGKVVFDPVALTAVYYDTDDTTPLFTHTITTAGRTVA